MDLEILKEILEDTFDITVKVSTIIKQIKKGKQFEQKHINYKTNQTNSRNNL